MEEKSIEELEQIGSGDALCEIGARYYKNKEYDKALEYIDKAIEKGSLSARVYKVRCYYYGKGLEQNYKEAYVIIHDLLENHKNELSQKDFIVCYSFVGEMLYCGWYFKKDHKRAAEIFLYLANKYNDDFSQVFLTEMYYYGKGVEKDLELAKKYGIAAIEQGKKYPGYFVGRIFFDEGNYELAEKYFSETLQRKYCDEYYYLGQIYEEGLNGTKDENKAMGYYEHIEENILKMIIFFLIGTKKREDINGDAIIEMLNNSIELNEDLVQNALTDENDAKYYLGTLKVLSYKKLEHVMSKFKGKVEERIKSMDINGDFKSEDEIDELVEKIVK